jgi:hypothetical protein
MKSKREKATPELRKQISWAEGIPDEEVSLMLLDGKSKTSCGCDVIGDETCPHGNMGILHLLMLQFTEQEIEEMREKAKEEAE